MVQEDQNQVCSDISDNNVGCVSLNKSLSSSSSKKLKQKKVPQRGLGVAQLERIRIEEQEKKDTTNSTTNTNTNISSTPTITLSHTTTSTSPFPSFQHNKDSKSASHFTPLSPSLLSNLPPQNPMLRNCTLSDIDNLNIGSIPPLNVPTNGRGFNGGWSHMPTNVNVSFPTMPTNGNGNGNGNVNFPFLDHTYEPSHGSVGENSRLEHHGFMFGSNLSLPYESCPIPPLPDLVPKWQQYHQPSSSWVNNSSMNHTSSSNISFHMEPPSSQSYCSNYSPLWPDEDKIMVGMKRPCPFPLDDPPIPPYYGKHPTLPSHSTSRSDKSTAYDNGGTSSNFDPTIPIFRDVPTCHSAMLELSKWKKSSRSDNGKYSNEDFLTLASPAIPSSPFPSSRLQQSSSFHTPHYRDFLNFESLPYRGSSQDIGVDFRQGGSSKRPNSFFNFFPSSKIQVASTSSSTGFNTHNNSEVGESVDLNLRL